MKEIVQLHAGMRAQEGYARKSLIARLGVMVACVKLHTFLELAMPKKGSELNSAAREG